jgi:hypothetical protein
VILGRSLRLLGACLLVLGLLVAISPLYRDFFLDRRDKYQGTSFADFLGPLAYDSRVLRDFSWGAWFWNPDKALGFPRAQDLGTRPMYPVQLVLARLLPPEQAWHWNHVFHVLIKVVGLVLLCAAFGWPFWIVVLASTGAMLADGALAHFADTTIISTAAWVPLQLWLTLRAARASGFSGWDAAWAVTAALRATSFHPQWGAYYEVFILLFSARVEWRALRARWRPLLLRYVAYGLLLAPWLLPAMAHYADSGRRHMMEFGDWHLRRAYTWWKYRMGWDAFWRALLIPWGLWLIVALAVPIGRLRQSVLWPVFGAYFVFGLFHAVPWLALPMWISGIALLPFRIPQRVFDPFNWLGILLLAEMAAREDRARRRVALAVLFVLGVGVCAWQTRFDPARTYIDVRWKRPMPERLVALVRAEPRAPAVFPVGQDRKDDAHGPLLNSNHNLLLGLPGAHFLGEVPSYSYARATYRVPGLLFMQRVATPLSDWDPVVDIYAELGIGWVFWDGAGEPVHPRLRLAGEENGFRLYRVEGARPHIYALDVVRRVARPRKPAGVSALIFSMPALGPFCYGCPEGATATSVNEVKLEPVWKPGDVTIAVESPRGTLLVLGETRASGWRATLDGAPTTIDAINEVYQGVAVPPGRHLVHWRFVSPGFHTGLALAALGAIGLAVAVLVSARRRRRDPG